jgi:hypothetical protein
VGALLLNRDPGSFDALYGGLPPGVRERLARLSPLPVAGGVAAPVELVAPPRDKYFPLAESRRLARRAPRGRLTVTRALTHADPTPSLDDAGELLALNRFVRRTLELARAAPPG